jgi:hypothetical protein
LRSTLKIAVFSNICDEFNLKIGHDDEICEMLNDEM